MNTAPRQVCIYIIDIDFQKERWFTSLFYGSSLNKE